MKIISKSNYQNVRDFVAKFQALALDVQEKYGLPALAVLAQAALETGWGSYILRVNVNGVKIDSKNIFNIKAGTTWQGKKGSRDVWEVINGKDVTVPAWFRVYDSYTESFDNYGEYICNRTLADGTLRYARALSEKDNPIRYVEEVHRAGYATDPSYAKKVCSIFANYFCLME
jgi:peptidoglycan hydrolase FlgJ